jgi:branched-chain amino acid transport system permease protein
MLMGVNTSMLSTIVFGISTMLAAIAGWSLVFVTNLHPFVGMSYTIKASIIVILGGMGSIVGAVVGSFILSIAETYIGYQLGTSWSPCIGLLFLLIILIVRPRGLFGHE